MLPPGYLCCGYPQSSAGDQARGQHITTQNRVLFHRVSNTLNYLDIRTVLVSCGTCIDQLQEYRFEQIFPGCSLLDIHVYLLERGVTLDQPDRRFLYLDPCHTPIKGQSPLQLIGRLTGGRVAQSDRCCGEAGTFAVARPDIATQLRHRKSRSLREGRDALRDGPLDQTPVTLLTTCPACLQGLSRYRGESGMRPTYPVIEIARQQLGEDWQQTFVGAIRDGRLEQVLL